MFQHDNQLCYIFADILVSPSLQFINNLSNQPASKSFSLKSYYFPTQSQFMSFERYFWNVVYYFDEGVGYHHTHFSGPSRAKSASLNVVWIVAHFVSGICSRLGQVQSPQSANRGAGGPYSSFSVLSFSPHKFFHKGRDLIRSMSGPLHCLVSGIQPRSQFWRLSTNKFKTMEKADL